MFNDQNNSSQGGAKEIDDIFSDVDSAPVTPPAPVPTTQNPVSPQALSGTSREAYLNVEDNMPAASERSTKALKIFLILLIVAAIISFAGYFVYAQFIKPKAEVVSNINSNPIPVVNENDQAALEAKISEQENNNIAATTTEPATASSTETSSSTVNIPAVVTADSVDTDSDGLNDQEEMLAGTDINKVDTDNDGLTDYEEVKTYLTNPLVVDTDGDTYSDGSEVKKGYNPNGAGKLPATAVK